MSDPSMNTGQPRPAQPASADLRQAGQDLRATAEQARAAAREAASTVAAEASQAANTLKQEGAALLDTARSRAEELAQQGQQAGADRTEGIARAVHKAAEALEQESPELARTVHDAAGAIDNIARALRDRSPGEMLRGAEDFARRQPMAFVGIAALAGFALARFAKASTPGMASHHVHTGSYAGAGAQPMGGGGQTFSDTSYGGGTAPGTGMSTGLGSGAGSGLSGSGMTGGGTGTSTTGSGTGGSYPHGPSTAHDASTGAPGWVADEDGTPRPATLASASLGGAVSYRPRGGTENG